ncbi:MAG: hypothetical protein V1927_07090 [Candidatus Omnitrophota bacterium]
MKKNGFAAFLVLTLIFIPVFIRPAFSQEEAQYKKFKLENVSCDAGMLYRKTDNGMEIGVSAIATGRGAEFRKWNVADIRLYIDAERIRPDKSDKFYVKKESFFRIPAAVLFAILGTQIDVGGSSLEKGIAKAGMAAGLGLLVLQAHGEITGEARVFNLDKDLEDKIVGGRDAVEITVENEDLHEKQTIRIGIAKTIAETSREADFKKMGKPELQELIDTMEGEVVTLEKEQGAYRYGIDAEYDEIQRKIEKCQTERGIAYKVWFEK